PHSIPIQKQKQVPPPVRTPSVGKKRAATGPIPAPARATKRVSVAGPQDLTERVSNPTPVRRVPSATVAPTSTPTPLTVEGVPYFDDVTVRNRNRNSSTGKLGRVGSLVKVIAAFNDPFPSEEALNRYISAQIRVDAEANDIPFRGISFTHTDKDRRAIAETCTGSRGNHVRYCRDIILALFGLCDEAADADYLREEIAWLLDSRTHFGNTPAGLAQLDSKHPRVGLYFAIISLGFLLTALPPQFRPYQNKALTKFVAAIRLRVTGNSDRQSITPEFIGFCMAMIKNALECYSTGSLVLVHFTEKRYGKYVTDIASNMRKVSFANTPWMNLGGILHRFNDAAFPVEIESVDPTGFVCYEEDSGEEAELEDEGEYFLTQMFRFYSPADRSLSVLHHPPSQKTHVPVAGIVVVPRVRPVSQPPHSPSYFAVICRALTTTAAGGVSSSTAPSDDDEPSEDEDGEIPDSVGEDEWNQAEMDPFADGDEDGEDDEQEEGRRLPGPSAHQDTKPREGSAGCSPLLCSPLTAATRSDIVIDDAESESGEEVGEDQLDEDDDPPLAGPGPRTVQHRQRFSRKVPDSDNSDGEDGGPGSGGADNGGGTG
ncbi:hypothetical protein P7C70_g9191, partial [Phenoliferia sp. Uapishka_3]